MASFFDSSAGGIIGGAASLVGSAIASRNSLKATRETNDMNYRIWGEQQQHNIDMFNMQNQANIDMWNMHNAYNDPSAQIQRLSAAGLNPYLAMGNNPSGVATNAPASGTVNPSTPPTMQAPPAEAFDIGLDKAVGRVMQGFQIKSQMDLNNTQGNKNNAETDQINSFTPILSDLYKAQGAHEWLKKDYTAESLENLRWQTNRERLAYRLDQQQFSDKAAQSRLMTRTMQSEAAIKSLDERTRSLLFKYAEPQQILTMGILAMRILEGESNIKKGMAEVSKLFSESFKLRTEGKLKGIEFKALEKARKEYETFILQQYLTGAQEQGANFFKYLREGVLNEDLYNLDRNVNRRWLRLHTREAGDWLRNLNPFGSSSN